MGREERKAIGKILYPAKWNEHDIAWDFMKKISPIIGNDYSIRPSVQAYTKTAIGVRQPRRCFMDLVLFKISKNYEAVAIVEIKRNFRRRFTITKQIEKYRTFGLPVFEIRGPAEINHKVEKLKNFIKTKETEWGGL